MGRLEAVILTITFILIFVGLTFIAGCSHAHIDCVWVDKCNEIYRGKPEFNCGECGLVWWWE